LIILLMGVSGSGKTTIGKSLAQRLSCDFEDADDFHSEENKGKMQAGIPLTDADRLPWLSDLSELLKKRSENGQATILACSALKSSYREKFSEAAHDLMVVYLKVDFETVAARLEARHHEFMNPELLKSQFDTLEEPSDAIVVDANRTVEEVVDDISDHVNNSTVAKKSKAK